MKSTPGPWGVDEKFMVSIEDAAQSDDWQAIGLHDEDGFAEIVAMAHPANAKLIAAAPDMLFALEIAEGAVAHYADMHQGKEVVDINAILEYVRASIKKAKGE